MLGWLPGGCRLARILAVLITGLVLPGVARGSTFGHARSEVLGWHLNPPPLFPTRLPAGHRGIPASVQRDPGFAFDVFFGAPAGTDCHTLPDPKAWCVALRGFFGPPRLSDLIHTRWIDHLHRVQAGPRTVWFFHLKKDAGGWWVAWNEHGRTHAAWTETVGSNAALNRLAPFVASLRPLAGGSPATRHRSTKILNGDYGSFVVRPTELVPTGDGSAFFGGQRQPFQRFGSLTWKRWGLAQANATGRFWIEHCHPTCGNRTYTSSPIRLHAWRAIGHRFTRLTASGPRIHRTLSLSYGGNGNWYWSWGSGNLSNG
jgi:hypothetical protein